MRLLMMGMVLAVGGCSLWEDATTIDVDYDVDLVEPVAFDGSRAVAPTNLAIAVSSTSPTSTPSISGAGSWGPLLKANAIAEAAGQPRLFSITVSGTPTFTGTAPVEFTVDVSSADGVVYGDELSSEPQPVGSCTFTLDPATDGPDGFGPALEACLVDWAAENGFPAQLAFSVTSASTVAQHGPGEEYELSGTYVMETDEAVEIDCELEVALPSDVTDRLDTIEFDGIQLDATGTADDPVFVAWFGLIFDSTGAMAASANGADALGAGDSREFHATVPSAGAAATVSGDATVLMSPSDPAEFLDATIRALSGADTGAPGGGMACWFSAGAAPRSGTLEVSISGIARAGL